MSSKSLSIYLMNVSAGQTEVTGEQEVAPEPTIELSFRGLVFQ